MEISNTNNKLLNAAALLLTLPTAYFIMISVMKYVFNIDGPFDNATPLLERLGIQENLGWNINLLIPFGPLIAFLITLFQVIKIEWNFNHEQFDFHVIIQKKWFPIGVAVFSGVLLLTLFIYLVGENLTIT